MKKIITSASVILLGTAGVQAAFAPGLSASEQAKPWSIQASLRGFYDDNYATAPSGPNKMDSFGFEVKPTFRLNFPMEQTFASLAYTYDMKYYENRSNSADHSHQATAGLSHAFAPDYKLDLNESFVIAQEAQLLDTFSRPVRLPGNNINNTAAINFEGKIIPKLNFLVGYENRLYDYDNAFYSQALDRMEHMATLNLRWQVLPQTVAILGYQFGMADYTAKPQPPTDPTWRNSQSHFVYAGADQNFTSQLNGSVRAGVQITEYPNAKNAGSAFSKDNSVTPYADAKLKYAYTVNSSAELGVKHQKSATDMATGLDQEATAVYGAINHQILPSLLGTLMSQYQMSSLFNGLGTFQGLEENYFTLGAYLDYQINKFLSAEAGYNFDRVDSDNGLRSFTRNRVYLGLRASY